MQQTAFCQTGGFCKKKVRRAVDMRQRFSILNRVLCFRNHLEGSSKEQPYEAFAKLLSYSATVA